MRDVGNNGHAANVKVNTMMITTTSAMMNINITRMMTVMALVMVMTDDVIIKLDKPKCVHKIYYIIL